MDIKSSNTNKESSTYEITFSVKGLSENLDFRDIQRLIYDGKIKCDHTNMIDVKQIKLDSDYIKQYKSEIPEYNISIGDLDEYKYKPILIIGPKDTGQSMIMKAISEKFNTKLGYENGISSAYYSHEHYALILVKEIPESILNNQEKIITELIKKAGYIFITKEDIDSNVDSYINLIKTIDPNVIFSTIVVSKEDPLQQLKEVYLNMTTFV